MIQTTLESSFTVLSIVPFTTVASPFSIATVAKKYYVVMY